MDALTKCIMTTRFEEGGAGKQNTLLENSFVLFLINFYNMKYIAIAPPRKIELKNYTSWLEKRGLSYIILKPGQSTNGFDALLLCGGADIGTSIERDEQEKKWFNEAYGKIPVIGICRGMQLSNVLLGGTLHENLSEENVKHTSNKVLLEGETKPISQSSFHDIRIVQELLESTDSVIKVNSRHHQGVKDLAKELSAVAYCTVDNLVEMAIGNSSLFVQWHPEKDDVWDTEAEIIVSSWINNALK